MKRVFRRVVPFLALLLSVAFAGPGGRAGEPGYHCPMDTQTCLDELVAKLRKSGWVGIEYDDTKKVGGFRITRVVPGSPAEGAGFKAGDILVSVDGARFEDDTADRCATCEKTKGRWIPGQAFEYVLRRGTRELHARVTLAALPSDVMAQMVGMHMLEHARVKH